MSLIMPGWIVGVFTNRSPNKFAYKIGIFNFSNFSAGNSRFSAAAACVTNVTGMSWYINAWNGVVFH